MDRLTISSAGGMGADYQGLANLRRRNPQGEEEFSLPGQAAANQDKAEAPGSEQAPVSQAPASLVAKKLADDLPALNLRQAQEVMQELAPAIAGTTPWKLAEIQPVSERSLIPSAYV